ncbi:MAG: GNAT family N-acetyltransferase [Longispora sp.]|nr:GNAT family N-acetyltransferase [Longispora sp. (in: high G+C Gram-positive bacteria)]
MNIRLAEPTARNLAIAVWLRRETAAWLESQGHDQWVRDWPNTETMVESFARDLEAGQTWFVYNHADQVLGCITLNQATAVNLWNDEEVNTALFVHRLTLSRKATGQGLGAQLLDFAGQKAQASGWDWLRLDAWTTNRKLHQYYMRQGFQLVRIVENHHSPSAACFERPAAYRSASLSIPESDTRYDSAQTFVPLGGL